ncbi:hypothetical protein Q8G28_17390 [Lysinibacillus capsici]|uniref:hypothetical protein n=1 Tax=Lysinibacillus capsici TaxID=2115968 RepID=UPI00273099B8|nr:hypothetical protein [Lysinibacillus capsici]MDP1395155.1 hypothetical protein [Lysinibacillus capsici]MDP1415346.1 hypothetical protein [Lysinibacillus capsici]MDP1431518.1 hypothetical protein [Lysinibacillus capsici]
MTNLYTDVPASIAGYFYQFLLAVNELTCLIPTGHDDDCVAIEKGADVRIFKQGDSKKSVEAKFYQDLYFTSNHLSICHTLYNFYTSFLIAKAKDEPFDHYEYRTNVPIRHSDKAFFDKWQSPHLWTTTEKEAYVKYIKMSIIRDRLNTDRGKKAMNEYKKRVHDAEMDAVFQELADGTSKLEPFLQQTTDGQGALSVFRRNDREAKIIKLQELQTSVAYIEPKSTQFKAVKPILQRIEKRTKKPGIEELFVALDNNEVDFADFTPTISISETEKKTIDLSEDKLFSEFAELMRFSFADAYLSKMDFIDNLKGEITNNLLQFDASLKTTDCEKIIHALIDKIFQTTVEEDSQGISMKEVKVLIEKHHEINQTHLKSYLADKLVQEVENIVEHLFSYKLRIIKGENAQKMRELTSKLFNRYLDGAFCYQMEGSDKFSYIPLEEFNRLFKLNGNGVSADDLANILLCLSIMGHYGEDTFEIAFQEKGINNIQLSQDQLYVLKNVSAYGDPNLAIIQFVHYILKTISEKKIRPEGFEKVFLFTDVDQLETQKWNMKALLSNYGEVTYVQDIARVIDVDDNKKLIESFVFKWDSMILPKSPLNTSIDFKGKVNDFIRR